MSDVILYDIPSRDPCRCWSLNPWKRSSHPMSLNAAEALRKDFDMIDSPAHPEFQGCTLQDVRVWKQPWDMS